MNGDRASAHGTIGAERRLRAAVLAGDEAAWRAWYDATSPRVRAYVHWRCGGRADLADEIVQETWLTAVRRVRTFRPEQGGFAGWLCGIAANLIRNRLRAQRCWPSLHASEEMAPRSDSDRTSENVAQALAELPAHYEAVLRAKYLDDLSVQDIAEQRGESFKAIESLLSRARQAFREAYKCAELADG
jgi:RNA polymerase sigma-70 factor (ECF subfamily)